MYRPGANPRGLQPTNFDQIRLRSSWLGTGMSLPAQPAGAGTSKQPVVLNTGMNVSARALGAAKLKAETKPTTAPRVSNDLDIRNLTFAKFLGGKGTSACYLRGCNRVLECWLPPLDSARECSFVQSDPLCKNLMSKSTANFSAFNPMKN